MELFSFEKLDVYKKSMILAPIIYKLVEKFPTEEKFSLTNQIHRAITSIPSNIAESCSRSSYKEKLHFIEIAYGSLLESYCQLQIGINLGYINYSDIEPTIPYFFDISRMLSGLKNSYANKL